MSKKIIFLFVAFLLPGLIYTFLRMFGSNSFAVAPLFQEEVVVPAGCPEVKVPYQLPPDIFTTLASTSKQDSLLLVFYEIDEARLGATAGNINEIERSFASGNNGIQLVKIKEDTLGLKCSLLVGPDIDIVLIDKDQIRGQYTSSDREEVDRLSTELDIILKKY
ncbi:MAG TPA: hypothetical protein VFE57_11225 [Cyclobacteriaceae bacterium]|jgi:hypothetical protein|nr:hypothetical protein [Cyclobacteriaceae bacterium]